MTNFESQKRYLEVSIDAHIERWASVQADILKEHKKLRRRIQDWAIRAIAGDYISQLQIEAYHRGAADSLEAVKIAFRM